MTAQFRTAPTVPVISFTVPGEKPPNFLTHTHHCCPFGWGVIYELRLIRIDTARNVAMYEVVSSRSEKP